MSLACRVQAAIIDGQQWTMTFCHIHSGYGTMKQLSVRLAATACIYLSLATNLADAANTGVSMSHHITGTFDVKLAPETVAGRAAYPTLLTGLNGTLNIRMEEDGK